MKPITLDVMQSFRLINAIKGDDLNLYNKIKTETKRYCRFHAEYDGTTYKLEIFDASYKPTMVYYKSWDSNNPIHDYIVNDIGSIS